MPIWKISDKGPSKVSQTKLKQAKILEEKLENWIVADTSLLNESLLIIGRQVIIPDVKDRLDLLALDPQGRAVIIELKRGKLKDPVDMQALRYASYISKWRFEDFENQARSFLGKTGDPDFNFNEIYEQFCSESGSDEIPDINEDQRMIIVGSEVKDKLGSVALWLREHTVDITVIEIEVYQEGDELFLQPQIIIPFPIQRFSETGRMPKGDISQPWIKEGKIWHLEKRCNLKTKELLLRINEIIQSNFDVDGPRWNQKSYVAYRMGNYNWISIITSSYALRLYILIKAGSFNQSDTARLLNVKEFNQEESMSEKLGLPSSIFIQNRNEGVDRIILRLKEDFDLNEGVFIKFLAETQKVFPKAY